MQIWVHFHKCFVKIPNKGLNDYYLIGKFPLIILCCGDWCQPLAFYQINSWVIHVISNSIKYATAHISAIPMTGLGNYQIWVSKYDDQYERIFNAGDVGVHLRIADRIQWN